MTCSVIVPWLVLMFDMYLVSSVVEYGVFLESGGGGVFV